MSTMADNASLCKLLPTIIDEATWYRADDADRLVRKIDIAMNGEAGAAKQAMLCDVVAQLVPMLARLRGIEERAQSAQKRLCKWPHNKSRTARVLRRILRGDESV